MRVTATVGPIGTITWTPAAAPGGKSGSVWVENMSVTGITIGSRFTLFFTDGIATGTVNISFK
jgi:hypothetical protein